MGTEFGATKQQQKPITLDLGNINNPPTSSEKRAELRREPAVMELAQAQGDRPFSINQRIGRYDPYGMPLPQEQGESKKPEAPIDREKLPDKIRDVDARGGEIEVPTSDAQEKALKIIEKIQKKTERLLTYDDVRKEWKELGEKIVSQENRLKGVWGSTKNEGDKIARNAWIELGKQAEELGLRSIPPDLIIAKTAQLIQRGLDLKDKADAARTMPWGIRRY